MLATEIPLKKMSLSRIFLFLEFVDQGFEKLAKAKIPRRQIIYELAALETQLNKTLFVKNNKNYILTEFGLKFYKFAQEIADRSQSLWENPKTSKQHFSIACPAGAAKRILPKIIARYIKENGPTDFSIRTKKEHLMMNHPCDISFGHMLTNRIDLRQIFLRDFTYGYFASENYLNQTGTPIDEEDLKKNHKILINDLFEEININDHQSINSDISEPLYELARLDQGIVSLCTDYSSEYGYLKRILPEKNSEEEKIYFIHPKFSPKLSVIEKFLKITKEVYKGYELV